VGSLTPLKIKLSLLKSKIPKEITKSDVPCIGIGSNNQNIAAIKNIPSAMVPAKLSPSKLRIKGKQKPITPKLKPKIFLIIMEDISLMF
jgi:hypothetical protein